MEDSVPVVLRLLLVLLLVFANAFFVATEFALVSVRKSRMETLAREGDAAAARVLDALRHLDFYIAGTQVGITLASLLLGWAGEEALSHTFASWFALLPEPWGERSSAALGLAMAFVVMTFLHVVLGELVPKSVALQYPDETSRVLATPIRAAVSLLRPLIWALNGTGNFVLRLLGLPPNSGHASVHSVEELKVLVDDSLKHGVLESHERQMVTRVFNLKDLTVRQVMVHRLDIVGLPLAATLADVQARLVDHPYSFLPVFDGDMDHVKGVLHVKDLIRPPQPTPERFDLTRLMRPILWVPETLTAAELLGEFRRERTQVAMVIDEYGGTSGLVTLEDVAREILGDGDQASQEPSEPIAASQRPTFVAVEGLTRLDQLNEDFGLTLEDEEVDTVAGLVIKHLGRLPLEGDFVIVEGLRLTVTELEGRRISMLAVTAQTPEVAEKLGVAPPLDTEGAGGG